VAFAFASLPPFFFFSTQSSFLTLGLWVVMTNSRTGSSMTQLLGRQRSESPKHWEQGKPPSTVGYIAVKAK